MRTFEDARTKLATEMVSRAMDGKTTDIRDIEVNVIEDGSGALCVVELEDYDLICAAFDFVQRIDPGRFTGGPYVAVLEEMRRSPTIN